MIDFTGQELTIIGAFFSGAILIWSRLDKIYKLLAQIEINIAKHYVTHKVCEKRRKECPVRKRKKRGEIMDPHIEKLCDKLTLFNDWCEHVQKVRDKCCHLALSAPENLYLIPISELARIYNGCGPDWLNKLGWIGRMFRRILTWRFDLLEPAFMVHDWRFDKSNGSLKGFLAANCEMFVNGIRCAGISKRWQLKNLLTFILCLVGAWPAWRDGCKKNKTSTTENTE